VRIWIIRPKFMKLIQYLFPDNFFRKWSGAFYECHVKYLEKRGSHTYNSFQIFQYKRRYRSTLAGTIIFQQKIFEIQITKFLKSRTFRYFSVMNSELVLDISTKKSRSCCSGKKKIATSEEPAAISKGQEIMPITKGSDKGEDHGCQCCSKQSNRVPEEGALSLPEYIVLTFQN